MKPKLARQVGTVLFGAGIVVACSSTPPVPAPEPVASTSAPLSIGNLFGTGVSAAGTVLVSGAIDPHYALTHSDDPAFPSPAGSTDAYVVDTNAYPVATPLGPWVADSTTSQWISVQAGNSGNAEQGFFDFALTFSLANVDPTTASISGSWACDNQCTLQLNGTTISLTSPSYDALLPFTIPAGSPFVAGTNTLTFVVYNQAPNDNPTGLRVDGLTGSAVCTQDSQCSAGSWCNNTSSPASCQATVANGVAVPGGNCDATAGSAPGTIGSRACTTGACDESDNKCGYVNGDGPCASGTVCRSAVCDPAAGGGTGRCEQCTKTNTTNCTASAPLCDSSTETCAACNGDNGAAASADCLASAPYCPGGGGVCATCGTAGLTATCSAAGATHAGTICETSGACGSSCVEDSNCSATQWCDAGACAAQLVNGTPIPTAPGHTPTLNGTCTASVGATVCASGVCDEANNACGYANGDGPCTVTSPGVCQSGVCSVNGTCRPAAGCNADGDCAAKQYCNTVSSTCLAQVATGSAIPGGGTCSSGTSDRCLSGLCGSDNICGDPNGVGPCTSANASGTSGVCRSGLCNTAANGGNGLCEQCTPTNATNCSGSTPICDSASETCVACNGDNGTAATAPCGGAQPYCPGSGGACTTCGTAGGTATCTASGATHAGGVCGASGACASACVTDANCASSQWCNTGATGGSICVAQLPNGTVIPTEGGHTPTLNGTCTVAVGAAVCTSGVCDVNTNVCGYSNGDGPCTGADPGVCVSGACSADGVCRPAGGCNVDGDCAPHQYCDVSFNTCEAQGATGLPIPAGGTCSAGTSDRCLSGVCGADNICGDPNGVGPCSTTNAAGTSGLCRSNVCDPAGNGGAGLCQQCTPSNATNCSGATPICATTTETCVACNGDNGTTATADCPAAAPYCPGGGAACTTCGTVGGTTTCAAAGAVHAGTVCESTGACGTVCVQDSDCTTTQWCSGGTCVAQLVNGTPIPIVSGHSPPLTGVCTTAAGASVCLSSVCDPKNNACGYASGDGTCTVTSPGVCQSGACSVNGTCRPAAGCDVDGDCSANQYCDSVTSTCLAQAATGSPIPGGGSCPAGTSDRCLSGVCASDDVCGDPNGSGPCTPANASGPSGICRSGTCDPKDSKCGLASGDGTCTAGNGATICRSGSCATSGGSSGDCVQCTSNLQCQGATPVCNTTTNTCVASGGGGDGGAADGGGGGDGGIGGAGDAGSAHDGGADSGEGSDSGSASDGSTKTDAGSENDSGAPDASALADGATDSGLGSADSSISEDSGTEDGAVAAEDAGPDASESGAGMGTIGGGGCACTTRGGARDSGSDGALFAVFAVGMTVQRRRRSHDGHPGLKSGAA